MLLYCPIFMISPAYRILSFAVSSLTFDSAILSSDSNSDTLLFDVTVKRDGVLVFIKGFAVFQCNSNNNIIFQAELRC